MNANKEINDKSDDSLFILENNERKRKSISFYIASIVIIFAAIISLVLWVDQSHELFMAGMDSITHTMTNDASPVILVLGSGFGYVFVAAIFVILLIIKTVICGTSAAGIIMLSKTYSKIKKADKNNFLLSSAYLFSFVALVAFIIMLLERFALNLF